MFKHLQSGYPRLVDEAMDAVNACDEDASEDEAPNNDSETGGIELYDDEDISKIIHNINLLIYGHYSILQVIQNLFPDKDIQAAYEKANDRIKQEAESVLSDENPTYNIPFPETRPGGPTFYDGTEFAGTDFDPDPEDAADVETAKDIPDETEEAGNTEEPDLVPKEMLPTECVDGTEPDPYDKAETEVSKDIIEE
jgi:hypothetical protein